MILPESGLALPDHALATSVSASSRARDHTVIAPHTLRSSSRWRPSRRIAQVAIRPRSGSRWPQTRRRASFPRNFFRCQRLRLGGVSVLHSDIANDSTWQRSRVDRV